MAHNTNNLSLLLLKLWVAGDLAATQVRDIAESAHADGWGSGCVLAEALAGVGSSARRARQNDSQVVMKATERAGIMPAMHPYHVDIPKPGGKIEMTLPHEVFAFKAMESGTDLWHVPQIEFDADFGLGRTLKEWGQHPDVGVGDAAISYAALGYHCDGVSYTPSLRPGEDKGILVGSMNIVSGQSNSVKGDRVPLFSIPKADLCKCGCGGYHTLQAVHDVLAWSCRCLTAGVSPSRRHDDSEWSLFDIKHRLPPRTCLPPMCLLQVRGDWEYMCQAFRFRTYGRVRFVALPSGSP